ncbi:MAG: hypothetical protein Q7S21_03925 [archaeon]|nr:hypothetical protein [archaeon]
MNRFLLVVVIIAVFAMGYAFLNTNNLLPGAFSFRTSFDELNQVWLKENIDPAQLENSNIETISLTQLNSIQSGINSFQAKLPPNSSPEVDAMKKLSQIHLDLIALLKEKKQLNSEINALPSTVSLADEEICEQIPALNSFQLPMLQIFEKSNNLNQKIKTFSIAYPSNVPNSYFDSINPNIEMIKSQADALDFSIEQLEASCNE